MIDGALTRDELEHTRTSLLGRKSGRLTGLMKELPNLAAEERREAGAAFNHLKESIEQKLESRAASFAHANRPKQRSIRRSRLLRMGRAPVMLRKSEPSRTC